MAGQSITFDKRLLGTWKSDRQRTFLHYKPKPGADPARIRKFKCLFGKLLVRWTRKKTYSGFGQLDSEGSDYEIVASDSGSVVIRSFCQWLEEDQLSFIVFDKDRYWMTNSGLLMGEWFRKVS